MPKRCARCGDLAGRGGTDFRLPGTWVAYLEREREVSASVGSLTAPLCRACASDAETATEGGEWEPFVEDLDPDALIDEGG